ncbi:MAG: hypothetical protein D6702_08890 [Planctomycetota bacterium]|nr:MAG: hypothetical protein D6702_08890 [Planctomycetota bacterium]
MPRPLLPFLLLPLFAAACQQASFGEGAPAPPEVRVLAEHAPANLAVLLPVVEATATLVPVEELRAEAHHALIERGFAPLAADYVDRKAGVEAVPAAAVRLPEAGVLALRVERWNDVRAESQGVLSARILGELYDENGRLAAKLGVDRTFRLGPGELAALPAGQRRSALFGRLFAELFAPLPSPPPL